MKKTISTMIGNILFLKQSHRVAGTPLAELSQEDQNNILASQSAIYKQLAERKASKIFVEGLGEPIKSQAMSPEEVKSQKQLANVLILSQRLTEDQKHLLYQGGVRTYVATHPNTIMMPTIPKSMKKKEELLLKLFGICKKLAYDSKKIKQEINKDNKKFLGLILKSPFVKDLENYFPEALKQLETDALTYIGAKVSEMQQIREQNAVISMKTYLQKNRHETIVLIFGKNHNFSKYVGQDDFFVNWEQLDT